MQPVITVTAQIAAEAAKAFRDRAQVYRDRHGANDYLFAGTCIERAQTMDAVASYLRDEPAAVSVNFDETAPIYWPLRVALNT